MGEPIYLLVRLRNVSSRDLPLTPLTVSSDDIAGNLGFVMSREDGVREFHPQYNGAEKASISPDIGLIPHLEPGRSWIIVVELLSYFNKEGGLVPHPGNRTTVGKGTYELKAFYRWDLRPGLVVRAETLKVVVEKCPLFDRLKILRTQWAFRRLYRQAVRGDPLRLCQTVYSKNYNLTLSGDVIRESFRVGLERDPLDTIGALDVIMENYGGPPLFLYDLIMYREARSDEDNETYHRFLDELVERWPDDFIGELARQKKKFEEIAAGKKTDTRRKTEKRE